jgi:phosphate transport system substrate-binding protein
VSRQSPLRHHNATFHQPTVRARAAKLQADRTKQEHKGRLFLSKKTLALCAVLTAAVVTLFSVAGSASAKPQAGDLTGAGSTFVSKLVQAWIPKVDSQLDIKLTYGPIGSGGGITAITNRTVDFAASDAPMSPDQFAACKGCVQIPFAFSATSVAYRGDGLPNLLKLTGPVITNIFMGRIKKWNDPAIRKLNQGRTLPDLDITVIHRSDGSGTTYNFTDYLSSVSRAWKSGPGTGLSVNWPTGVGARGSSGVSAALSQTQGGITYVDVAFSLVNHFKFAKVQNKAGVFQTPGLRGINAAGQSIKKVGVANTGLSVVNPAKKYKLAYPICTFVYMIVPRQTSKAPDVKKFLRWALTKGQADGPKLLFARIPKVVLNSSVKTLNLVST